MAAITETSVGRSNIRLTSTEFPDLSVEGGRGQARDLRKKLNNMMREKRRKSGGTLGKSPRFNKLSADPKKAVDQSNLKDMIDYESNIPEEPDGFSNLPHIRRRQKVEAKSRREQRASQLAPQAEPALSERSHPLLKAQDRRKQLEQPSDFYADRDTTAGISLESADSVAGRKSEGQKYEEKLKMMLTRGEIDPNSPEVKRVLGKDYLAKMHGRHLGPQPSAYPDLEATDIFAGRKSAGQEYKEKVKKMIADGELDADSPEAKRILGSGEDPSPMVGPGKELEQKEVSPESLAELDAIDKQLKEGQGEEGLIDISKEKVEQAEAKKPTGEVSEEPIRYDKNGYPIYHKDSKMAEAFRQAHKNAPNNSKFMWNGKEYWKGGKEDKKEDEKAAVDVARQDFETGDANIAESLYTPQEKIEKKIKQIEQISKGDHHPEWSEKKKEEEKEKIIEDLDKEETAEIREADPDFYVDPWTGFAIDLNKLQARQDRKDIMEEAALLPADQRALHLMQNKLISEKDLKKLLEPSEMELLDMQIKKMNLNVMANNLKLTQQKLQDYRTPEQLLALQQSGDIAKEKRAEAAQIRSEKRAIKSGEFGQYIKLYNNAVQNEDYEGQIFFGTQMGFPQAKMQKIATARMDLQLKSTKKKDKDEFKGLFQHEYSKVLTDRKSFVFGASSVFEEGMMQMEFNGKTYKGRKGLLDAMGLSDWEDLIPAAGGLSQEQFDFALQSVENMQVGHEIFDHPEFQNEDGSANYDALLRDKQAYKRFLMDNIIHEGMSNIYGAQYGNILKYEEKLLARQRQALEPLNEIVTQRQG